MNKTRIRRLGLATASFLVALALARCNDSPTTPTPPIASQVEETNTPPEPVPTTTNPAPNPSSLKACFVYHQIIQGDPEPCTVAFDATCSAGAMKEYRWFFEGWAATRPSSPGYEHHHQPA